MSSLVNGAAPKERERLQARSMIRKKARPKCPRSDIQGFRLIPDALRHSLDISEGSIATLSEGGLFRGRPIDGDSSER